MFLRSSSKRFPFIKITLTPESNVIIVSLHFLISDTLNNYIYGFKWVPKGGPMSSTKTLKYFESIINIHLKFDRSPLIKYNLLFIPNQHLSISPT